MRSQKQHRMTAKTRKALELAASLIEVPIEKMRRDQEAIRLMYASLEGLGYQWVASKQEWALVAPEEREEPTMLFTVMCETRQKQDITYVLAESMKAGGFVIVRQEAEDMYSMGQHLTHIIYEVAK